MNNGQERAESRRRITPIQSLKIDLAYAAGTINDWTPRISPRNLLRAITGLGAFAGGVSTINTADAAGDCKIHVAFHGYGYIDMYDINATGRPGKNDITEDPKTGPAVNYLGEVLDKKGNVIGSAQIMRRPIPKEIKDKLPNPGDRNNPKLIEEGYGITPEITLPCEADGQAHVLVRTSQNRADQEDRVIGNGITRHEMTGRKLESKQAIQGGVVLLNSDDPRRKITEEWLNKPATPEASPTSTAVVPQATPVTGKVEVSGNVGVTGSIGVDGTVTVEGGQNPLQVDAKVDVTKREEFLWLPFSIVAGLLGAGALIGLGAAASRGGRSEVVTYTPADVEAERQRRIEERERARAEREARLVEQRRLREEERVRREQRRAEQQRIRDERHDRGYRWYNPLTWRV